MANILKRTEEAVDTRLWLLGIKASYARRDLVTAKQASVIYKLTYRTVQLLISQSNLVPMHVTISKCRSRGVRESVLHYPKSELCSLVERHLAGKTVAKHAKRLGVDPTSLGRVLRRAGLVTGRPGNKMTRLTDDEVNPIYERWIASLSPRNLPRSVKNKPGSV
jgi:hypothetical protein